jgi:hypothetical protein
VGNIDSMAMNDLPPEKRLRHAEFVIHATRGLIRDQRNRRRAMVIVITAAVVLMILGATILKNALNPHEQPGWFIFFWFVCAWLTITAILIAVFDLLTVTSEGRKAERELRSRIEQDVPDPDK